MARFRAIPTFSPSAREQTPFADVTQLEIVLLLAAFKEFRLKDYYMCGFEANLKRCGALLNLPASLPPFCAWRLCWSPHICDSISGRYSTDSFVTEAIRRSKNVQTSKRVMSANEQ